MKICIDGLELVAIVGVREHEREVPQTLLIDVEFVVAPPSADAIDAAVDYSAVVQLVQEHVRAGRYFLIETVAKTTAERLAAAYRLEEVRVRVVKPAASAVARSVSAEHWLRGGAGDERSEC